MALLRGLCFVCGIWLVFTVVGAPLGIILILLSIKPVGNSRQGEIKFNKTTPSMGGDDI